MKKILLLLLILNGTYIIIFTQELKIEINSKTQKYGVTKSTSDTTSIEVLPQIYEGYRNFYDTKHYLLFEKEKENKNLNTYCNCILLDSTYSIIKEFSIVYDIKESRIIASINKRMSLWDVEANKFIISEKENIFFPRNRFSDPTVTHYSPYEPWQGKEFEKYIAIWEHGKTFLLDWNLNEVLEIEGKENISAGDISIEKDCFGYLNFIVVGEKIKTLYDFNGNKILDNISEIHALKKYSTYGYSWKKSKTNFTEIRTKDGHINLINDTNVFIKNTEGEKFLDVIHLNKFIVKRKDGYVVFDSLGNRFNENVYQTLLEPSSPLNGYASPVLLNNQWFFVDDNYNPLNKEKYYEINRLGSGDFKVIKSKDEKNSLFVYDHYGKQATKEPVDEIKEFYDLYCLALKKGDKYCLFYEKEITDYAYNSISELCYSEDYVKAYKNGAEVLINTYSGQEYLSNEMYDHINCIEDESIAEEFTNVFIAFKNGKFQIVTINNDNINISKNNFEDYFINEGPFYDYNLFSIKKDGKWGAISTFNLDSLAIPAIYDALSLDGERETYELLDMTGGIKVKKNGKLGLLNPQNNKILVPCEFDEIILLDEYIITVKNKLYGIYYPGNNSSYEICPNILLKEPDYNFIEYNTPPMVVDANVNGKTKECFLTRNGVLYYDEVKQPEWDGDEYLQIKHNSKWGLISTYSFDTLIKPEYKSIKRHPNYDYFLVEKNEKHGICDYYGKPVLGCIYDELIPFQGETYDLVKLDGKWGAFQNGNEVIPIEFEELIYKNESFYFKKNGLWGCLDLYGRPVLEAKYKSSKKLEEALREQ